MRAPRHPWATPKGMGDVDVLARAWIEAIRALDEPVLYREVLHTSVYLSVPKVAWHRLDEVERVVWQRQLGREAHRVAIEIGQGAHHYVKQMRNELFDFDAFRGETDESKPFMVVRGPRFDEHPWATHFAAPWMAGRLPLAREAARRAMASLDRNAADSVTEDTAR